MSYQNRQRCAVAVFVKTPGLSPIKTRLGAGIGDDNALHFFELSSRVIEENLKFLCRCNSEVTPFWAVAEEDGMESGRWNSFARIYQGSGDLGLRLHQVYSQLKMNYDGVILVGADSPQISSKYLERAVCRVLQQYKKNTVSAIIGPAADGGFYLFGSIREFSEKFWTGINYSSSQTCEELIKRTLEFGEVQFLPEEFDVDTIDDLMELREVFSGCRGYSKAHWNLSEWLTSVYLSNYFNNRGEV